MIWLFMGENSFTLREAIQEREQAFGGNAERIDGSDIELRQLPDLLMGGTLFADTRLVIVNHLLENKSVWERLPEWLPRVSEDVELILVESKPDKRTSTYKALKKEAHVQEFNLWTDRDRGVAEKWVRERAEKQSLKLDARSARALVERVGLDQWQLSHAIEKLSLVGDADVETIEHIIDQDPTANVFQLFEWALDGRVDQLHSALRTLELTEDPYRLFGLLSTQAFQLAAVAAAPKDVSPAKDFAIHPYVASKLTQRARTLGAQKAQKVLAVFAQTDADMKRSKAEPWLLIERVLLTVASQ